MFNEKFQDIYFQENAIEESLYVFIQGNNLPERFENNENFSLCELGFGTGLNFLLTAKIFLEKNQKGILFYHSIEKYPLTIYEIQKTLSLFHELKNETYRLLELLKKIYYPAVGIQTFYFHPRIRLSIHFDDVYEALKKIHNSYFDAWYLDGFAPSKNPEMWSWEVCKEMARLSHKETTFATYSSAGLVKRNLIQAGFTIYKVKGFGKKKHMLIGNLKETRNKISKNHSKDIAIIGGGIAGITTSLSLLKRGYHVHLFEKHNDLATEASAVPSAVIMPYLHANRTTIGELSLKSFNFTTPYLFEIQNQNLNSHFLFKGIYRFIKEKEKIEKSKIHYQIKNTCIREHQKGFYYKGYFIDNKIFLSLIKQLLQNYTHFYFYPHTNIVEYQKQENQIILLDSKGKTYEADIIIFCNSHTIKSFFPYVEIQEVRGQLIEIHKKYIDCSAKKTIIKEIAIVPLENRISIGSSFEPYLHSTQRERISDQYIIGKIYDNFPSLFNQIAQYYDHHYEFTIPNEAFVGMRSQSKDFLPNIGAIVDYDIYTEFLTKWKHNKKINYYDTVFPLSENEYVLSNLGSKGYTLAPFSAEIIASLIDKNPIPLEENLLFQLSPARFLFRKWKENKKIYTKKNKI